MGIWVGWKVITGGLSGLGFGPGNDLGHFSWGLNVCKVMDLYLSQPTPLPRTTRPLGGSRDDRMEYRLWLHPRKVRRRSKPHSEYCVFLRGRVFSNEILEFISMDHFVIETRNTGVRVADGRELLMGRWLEPRPGMVRHSHVWAWEEWWSNACQSRWGYPVGKVKLSYKENYQHCLEICGNSRQDDGHCNLWGKRCK